MKPRSHNAAKGCIRFTRHRVAATLPLRPSVFRAGAWVIEVLDVLRQPASWTLLIRYTIASPGLLPAVRPRYEIALRNLAHGEALIGSPLDFPGAFRLFGLFGSTGFYSAGIDPDSSGFATRTQRLRFPQAGFGNLDGRWFDAAEIVLVESIYTGRVTRSWSADSLRIVQER